MAKVSKSTLSIIEEGLKSFQEAYIDEFKYNLGSGYRLEQCGKRWRVMHISFTHREPKTDWMTYEEADALKKLFEASTD